MGFGVVLSNSFVRRSMVEWIELEVKMEREGRRDQGGRGEEDKRMCRVVAVRRAQQPCMGNRRPNTCWIYFSVSMLHFVCALRSHFAPLVFAAGRRVDRKMLPLCRGIALFSRCRPFPPTPIAALPRVRVMVDFSEGPWRVKPVGGGLWCVAASGFHMYATKTCCVACNWAVPASARCCPCALQVVIRGSPSSPSSILYRREAGCGHELAIHRERIGARLAFPSIHRELPSVRQGHMRQRQPKPRRNSIVRVGAHPQAVDKRDHARLCLQGQVVRNRFHHERAATPGCGACTVKHHVVG